MKIQPLNRDHRGSAPQPILPILTVALISGLIVTTYQISYGSLIFSGDLAPYLSAGIGFCLMGVVLIGGIEALLSGNPGMVANPTVASAVIVATMGAQIADELSGAPERIFPTVTASITVATLLTGGAFLVLGWFRLGNLIRYIPYPVIGGFLAGTGWLVAIGALKTMNGVAFNLANLTKFSSPEAILRWLPGVLFGIFLLLLGRRFKHYLVTPLAILGAVILFYLILWFSGLSIEQATQLGLLFKPFSPGALWQPPPLGDLTLVDWGAIARLAGNIATLILISSITILLYSSGVEVTAGKEIDLNRELSACGVGNLAAAFSASPPGYTIITMSVLSSRLGANSRWVGLLMAAICTGVMFFGGPLIALFPKPVLGGVLFFLGLTFLVDWLYDGWRRLSHADYAIVVVILVVMSALGLLPGLAVGVALAAGLFIVQYSRIPVVRHVYSGRSYHSRVLRSHAHTELLREEGQALAIFELQGYVFFGTANRIFEQIKERLQSPQASSLRVVALDFRQVNGIDASAALSFVRLKRLLIQHHILLVFTGLSSTIEQRMQREVLTAADRDHWRLFSDLDHAMEWFEDQVLQGEAGLQAAVQAEAGAVQAGQERAGLALLFATLGTEAEQMGQAAVDGLFHLMEYLERRPLETGEVLIRQGENHSSLYFLDAGELSVERVAEGEMILRLETSGPGAIVGELSAYLNVPASATVTAKQASIVYRLSVENLRRLELEDPQTAAILHRFLLKRTGDRLLNAIATVEALLG
jgi:sulfate permease, SulP family